MYTPDAHACIFFFRYQGPVALGRFMTVSMAHDVSSLQITDILSYNIIITIEQTLSF